MVPDYSLDIILFTVLLKIVLLPFNIAQTKSMVKTQMIQPKIKELQNKYKNDQQKLGQAQMDLYKQEGVSPFGGCLPLLLQWPILIGMFWVFRNYNYGDAALFGIGLNTILSKSNPMFVGIILAALSGLSTYVSTLILTPKTQDAGQMSTGGMNSSMNIGMSIFFAYISWTMTMALVFYWIVNNLLQLGIQYALNKAIRKESEVAQQK
jgi:membrane protein insertase, YidC/Oxa1 family, C-terminal domain